MVDEQEKPDEEERSKIVIVDKPISEEENKPRSTLKKRLMARSEEIQIALNKELETLTVPTTVAELSKKIRANRMSIEKYVLRALEEKQYPLEIARVGGYDVIYRVCND